MKRISDTEYVFVDKKNKSARVRMWHDCANYRGTEGRRQGRVELDLLGQDKGGFASYKCPRCGHERLLEVRLLKG